MVLKEDVTLKDCLWFCKTLELKVVWRFHFPKIFVSESWMFQDLRPEEVCTRRRCPGLFQHKACVLSLTSSTSSFVLLPVTIECNFLIHAFNTFLLNTYYVALLTLHVLYTSSQISWMEVGNQVVNSIIK